MAKVIDIPEVQGLPPESVGAVRINPNIADPVYARMFGLGREAGAFGKTLQNIHINRQVTDSRISDMQSWNDFRTKVNQDPDYTKYVSNYEEWNKDHAERLLGTVTDPHAKQILSDQMAADQVNRKQELGQLAETRMIATVQQDLPGVIDGLITNADTVDQGNADASEYIERLKPQIGVENTARWHIRREVAVDARRKQLEVERVEAENQLIFEQAMQVGDSIEAQQMINTIPDKDRRNELLTRVKRQYDLQANQVTRDQDAIYKDLQSAASEDNMDPITIDGAYRTGSIREQQWKDLKKMLEPSALEFNYDAYANIKKILSEYRNGADPTGKPVTRADVDKAITDSKSKLLAADAKSLLNEMYTIDTATDPLKSSGAKSGTAILSGWRTKGLFTSGDINDDNPDLARAAQFENDHNFLISLNDFEEWSKATTNATPKDAGEYLQTTVGELNFGTKRSIGKSLAALFGAGAYAPLLIYSGKGQQRQLTEAEKAPIVEHFQAIPLDAKRGYFEAKEENPETLVQDYMDTWRKQSKIPTLADQMHYLRISNGDTNDAEKRMQADGFVTDLDQVNQ